MRFRIPFLGEQPGDLLQQHGLLQFLPAAGSALPVGGIVGSGTLEEIHADLRGFEQATAALGSPLRDPFMSLAFASIPHIPHYGITDKGWYDTFAEQFVDIVLE